MAVHECLALHPYPLPHGEGWLGGTHQVQNSWAQQALQEINSFQAGSSEEACSFCHEHKCLALSLVPSQAITVHFLIAAAGSASQWLWAEQ